MTEALQPGLELLRAYVYEDLDGETAEKVRRWLYTGATEDELRIFDELVRERQGARARLEEWAARPLRARLLRLVRRIERSVGAAVGAIVQAPLSPAFEPLSGRTRDDLELELPPGVPVDLELRLDAPGHYLVVAVETDGRVTVLKSGYEEKPARIALPAMEFQPGDRAVDLVLIVHPHTPLHVMAAPQDETDLMTFLERPDPERRVLHRTIRCAREPLGPPARR